MTESTTIMQLIGERACTAAFLSRAFPEADLGALRPYIKYTMNDGGAAVYYRDATDTQADGDASRLVGLQARNGVLLAELSLSREDAETEMRAHMARLHDYNAVKDAGQALLGRLAVLRGTTTKALYPEFGLQLDD